MGMVKDFFINKRGDMTKTVITHIYILKIFIFIIRKAFSEFYCRHFELIEKDHVSLIKLMQQGIFNPEFYGVLVYKFKKIIGNQIFSNLLKRVVIRFKRAGYTLDFVGQTACLVFNPSMIEGYAALLSCTAMVQALD